MKVAVVRDVKHEEPWTEKMDNFLPAGTLVVVTDVSGDGCLVINEKDTSRHGWYVRPSSVEIIGDL